MKNPEGIRLRAMKRIALLTAIAAMCTWSTALGFSVSFTPDTLDFGEVPVGRTDSLTCTLTNTGTGTATGSFYAVTAENLNISFQPDSVTLDPGASVDVNIRLTMYYGYYELFSMVSFGDRTIRTIPSDDPRMVFRVRPVSSGLNWYPFDIRRSLYEHTLVVSGSGLSAIQSTDLRLEPDIGLAVRLVTSSQDSILIGITADSTAPPRLTTLFFENSSTTIDSLFLFSRESYPQVLFLPMGNWLGDTLDFSQEKSVDTLAVRGFDFWPGCRFEFADSSLSVISNDLFADTLALLGVRLRPGVTLDSTLLLAINPDNGTSFPAKVIVSVTDPLPVEPEPTPPGSSLPRAFSLGANFPNPFNPSTTITYHVPEGAPEHVSLKVYNLRGQLVATLVDSPRPPGEYGVTWDGTDNNGCGLPSGVYFYRMNAGPFHSTRKMVLLK